MNTARPYRMPVPPYKASYLSIKSIFYYPQSRLAPAYNTTKIIQLTAYQPSPCMKWNIRLGQIHKAHNGQIEFGRPPSVVYDIFYAITKRIYGIIANKVH